MRKPPTVVTIQKQVRYKCPECEQVLEDGVRRCEDCNKFANRIEILGTCPHCDEVIEEFGDG